MPQESFVMNFESSISRASVEEELELEFETAPKKKVWPWVFGAILLVGAILAGTYYALNRDTGLAGKADGKAAAGSPAAVGDKKGKQVPNVTVTIPGKSTIPNFVSATGTLAARNDMPIGAVGEGGLVTRVLVDAGQWVQAGQTLVIVDRQVQAQQSSQLAAQIQAAEADARLAQNELDRARALQSRGFVSKADIDRKTAQRDSAQARVRVAKAQLNENAARIQRLDIRAPASGLILSRNVEQGQVVSPGSGALFRIAMGGEMEMHAQMSEADLARMGIGYGASITPVGTQATFNGRIWQLSPVIDPQTRQGTARIAIGYNRALRPGGFAAAKINVGAVTAPFLPESAIQSDAQGSYVLIVDASNIVRRINVKIGAVGENGVSVLEGLQGTEKVVMSAGGFLNPGETVSPQIIQPKS
jgi:HlyD family secretion protein